VANFKSLLSYNEFNLRGILAIARPGLNHDFYIIPMRLLFIFIFIAFVANFYKSFFTINSLEYGTFNNLKLKDIFASDKIKVFIEIILRVIIILLFILLESILIYFPTIGKEFSFNLFGIIRLGEIGFFRLIGINTICLYSAMLIWLFYYWIFISKEKIAKGWYVTTLIQFLCGIIIGGCFWILNSYYTEIYLLNVLLGLSVVIVIASFVLIATIIINESKKMENIDGNTVSV
jgi:hypothetical protein